MLRRFTAAVILASCFTVAGWAQAPSTAPAASPAPKPVTKKAAPKAKAAAKAREAAKRRAGVAGKGVKKGEFALKGRTAALATNLKLVAKEHERVEEEARKAAQEELANS